MNPHILNTTLFMRLKDDRSVNERLQEMYPHVGEKEADKYRRECGLALSYGEAIAEKMFLKELPTDQAGDLLLLERFPWLEPESVSRVLSYGIHSAVHNFGTTDY